MVKKLAQYVEHWPSYEITDIPTGHSSGTRLDNTRADDQLRLLA